MHKRTTKDYQLGSKEFIDTLRLFVKMKIADRFSFTKNPNNNESPILRVLSVSFKRYNTNLSNRVSRLSEGKYIMSKRKGESVCPTNDN